MAPTYTFFAVGKGNMTLIEFTNGIKMLVDCRRALDCPSPLQYLRQKGLLKLDFVVITHPHCDHLTGFEELCEAMKPRFLWHNGRLFTPDPVYDDWLYYEQVRRGDVSFCKPVQLRDGQAATIGNARLAVAGPRTPYLEGTTDDENNNGIILSITDGNSKVVITGDTQIEQWDVVNLSLLASPAVFLASHHGRQNGLSRRAMKVIAPQRIVISDGPPSDNDATDEYAEFAPVSTTRSGSVVVRPQADTSPSHSQAASTLWR